jgi:hypothetical protein
MAGKSSAPCSKHSAKPAGHFAINTFAKCLSVVSSLGIFEPVRQEQLKSEQHEKAVANQLIQTLGCSATYLQRGAAGIQPDQLYSIERHGTVKC